jgi:hypothetical protein
MEDQACRSDCDASLRGQVFRNQRIRFVSRAHSSVVKMVGDQSAKSGEAFRRGKGGHWPPFLASNISSAVSEHGALLVIQAELKVMNSLELKPTNPKQMSGVFCQSSRRLPDFHRFYQVHHSSPVLISDCESGNRQQLVSIKLKQLFDECQLQYFSGDERDCSRAEMAGSHQISCQRLCRFQDDDRNR